MIAVRAILNTEIGPLRRVFMLSAGIRPKHSHAAATRSLAHKWRHEPGDRADRGVGRGLRDDAVPPLCGLRIEHRAILRSLLRKRPHPVGRVGAQSAHAPLLQVRVAVGRMPVLPRCVLLHASVIWPQVMYRNDCYQSKLKVTCSSVFTTASPAGGVCICPSDCIHFI